MRYALLVDRFDSSVTCPFAGTLVELIGDRVVELFLRVSVPLLSPEMVAPRLYFTGVHTIEMFVTSELVTEFTPLVTVQLDPSG
jgi:hypothetical protein